MIYYVLAMLPGQPYCASGEDMEKGLKAFKFVCQKFPVGPHYFLKSEEKIEGDFKPGDPRLIPMMRFKEGSLVVSQESQGELATFILEDTDIETRGTA